MDMPHFNMEGAAPRAGRGGMPKPPKFEKQDIKVPAFEMPAYVGPSFAVYALLTFIPTIIIFMLSYNYFLRNQYFAGLSFFTVVMGALRGDLAERLGLALEAEHVPNPEIKGKRRKVPVDAKGRPLTARGELDNAAMKAKFVSVALRARRHVLKGLSDEEYLRRCVAEAVDGVTGAETPKKRVKVASGLLTFLEAEENAVRRCTTVEEYNNVIKHENLAIIIGVSTDETPFAVEDAEKLTHHLFSTNHAAAMGKYTTCLYSAESTGGTLTLLREKAAGGRDGGMSSQHRTHMKPTSPNLMALIADIATCRSRRWGNVVVYVAAPMRTTPVMWLDEKLARDEATNFLLQESFVRKDMTCVIGDPNVVQGATTSTGGYYFTRCSPDDTANNAPPPLPRFTLEFLAETNDPEVELSWVDLNLFVNRLREAVAESNALIELTTQCLRAKATNSPIPKPSTTANSTVQKALRQSETSYTLLIDAAYDPEAARDSIKYLTSPDEFFCDPYVGISEEEIERHKKQQEQLQRTAGGLGAGAAEFRLVVPPHEKPLFMPPAELMDTLCKLTLHEAVAYSTVTQLLHQQNLSVMVTPRRNYFVEKSVRQSLMKQRMATLNNALAGEGATASKPATLKTPASVLLGMLTESSSTTASFGGGITTGGASHTNNPLFVGYSDFVRVLFEGFYHAVSATGTIPDLTTRPSADGSSATEAAAASAAMACPSIRGTPEDSSFYCGRMTPSSLYQYAARHPHMKCFAPLPALTNEDGTPIVSPSGDVLVTKSSVSVTSTAAAGARVTTTAVPLVAMFTRGRHLDSVLFSQVSLAPRGAHASVVPPLSLMPSTAMMRQCEECLMPYFLPNSEKIQQRTNAATFLHIYPSEDRPRYAATPIMQTLCWNAELLRISTDGVHMFDLTSFIPSTPTEDAKSNKAASASRDPKLMAEEVLMRFASSIIEHNSMAHFGTVPTYSEAVRVWSWLRECAVMTIMLLRADAVVGNPVYEEVTRQLRELLLKKTEEEGDKDEKASISRLTLVFVYDTPANSVPAESAADHAPSVFHVSLPSASMLDVSTVFRSRYLTPALAAALCCTTQDLTLLSHTVAEVKDEVSSPTDKRAAALTEQYQRRVQAVTSGGTGTASNTTPCVTLEEACQSLFPSLGGSTANPFLATYSGELTEYVAPLLRGFLLLRGAVADGNKVQIPSSASAMASEVLDAVLKKNSAEVIRRMVNIRPSVDQDSLQACLLAILQAARSSVAAAAGNTTHNGHAPRVPQCEVFAHFSHLLRPPTATMTAEKVTPTSTQMFLRTVTLFSDCLAALQMLGLVATGVFGNDSVVVNLLTSTSYSTSGYAASVAALALRSDNANIENAVGTTFAEDLIPMLLLNPLAIDALSMRYGDLLKVSRNATAASQESVSAAQDTVEALSYPVVMGHRNEETKTLSYSLEKRTIYSTRFYQLAMPASGQWVRTLSCVRAVIAYIRTALATGNVASAAPQATLTLAHSIEMLVEEVCDSVFMITAVQSGPISGVIGLLTDAEASLREVVAAAESKSQKTLSAVVGAKESGKAAVDDDKQKDLTKGSYSAVALNDIQAAIKRIEGYLSFLRYIQGTSPSALPPPVAEFWTQLAHCTSLVDGNVGRPPVFPEEPSTEKKIVLQEYKFDDDEQEKGDKNKEKKGTKTSADTDETNKAAAVKKDTNDELDDPRLFDGYCPIRLIRASKPPTSQPLTVAEQRQLLATESPPKVQFMQLFEREDLGGDDDEPSTVEELGSDADEDDLAEFQAKENAKRVKREAAREANAKGILLRTDKPVVMKARTYYRGGRDYLMLCNALPQQSSFPWTIAAPTDSTTCSPILSAPVSCLAYVDDKLYAGHYNGDLTVLIPATGEIDHVLLDAHKGAPVVTIFPFGRKFEDMDDAMYYQSYQAKVGRGDDNPPDPALVYLREKKLRENGGKINTSMVTASSLNRCIRIWPNNTLSKEDLEGGRAEPVMMLDREQSIKMKDPMARCFFTQLARRGVDERQFRQNVGNPEERNARSLAGYTSLTTGPHGKPLKGEQDMGYKDTVLLCYGSTMEATQTTADAMYNEQSFVGVGGVTQCCASFTVPPGYAVTAAVVAPVGPNGEARVAVAVSEVEPPGNKLRNHRLMQFEVLRSA